MTEEFNLSERIINKEPEKWGNKGYPIFHEAILRDDVREFIRRLKEKVLKVYPKGKYPVSFFEIIDTLAGKQLVGEQK